mmetsp:Transcript_98323/g.306160  ORF Transcript_98323/g.306160 Transcript_98323/m.306160 type:complete len:221 (-) Transcript_98323:5-667(-)
MAPQGQLITHLSQNKTAPKWSFGGRRGVGERPGTPGPGAYGRGDARSRCPSYGFGTSTRDRSRPSTAPGPGQYTQERPASAGPRYGFGSSQRGVSCGSGVPGPGSYQPNFTATRIDAPKYTATPRRDIGRGSSETPGPGSYKAPIRPESAKAPTWGFGTSTRLNLSGNHSPGPGTYNNDSGLGENGPKYTVRARTEGGMGYGPDSPGPGTYGGQYTQFGY